MSQITLTGGGKSKAGVADIFQAYLLDLSTYAVSGSPGGIGTIGREFFVTANAKCYGVRFKVPATAAGTVTIKLYRVWDLALLGSRSGLSITADVVTELLFTTPIGLVPNEIYRVCYYDSAHANYYIKTSQDEPNGAITHLTHNTTCASIGDYYPNSVATSPSWAGEPIIYSTVAAASPRPTVATLLDTFTGAGGLEAHAPDTGGPWDILNGLFADLAGGLLNYATGAAGANGVAVVNGNTGNVEVICTLKVGYDSVVFRSSADGTIRYALVANTTQKRFELDKYTALTTYTTPSNSPTNSVMWNTGDSHTITILLRGTWMRALADGVLVWNYGLIAPQYADNNYHGVGTRSRSWALGDINWDSINVRAFTGWKEFVILGDSISAESGMPATDDDRWPQIMTAGYNSGRAWPNMCAIGAAHIVSGLGHLSEQVDNASAYTADYIIILIGTNDGTEVGLGTIAPAYEADLVQLDADHPGVPIYCCGVLNCTTLSAANRASINADIQAAITAAALLGVNCTWWDTEGWIDDSPDEWVALTVYALNSFARATGVGGKSYAYKATTGGTSGGAEPAWPVVVGGTVVDGTVTWTCEAMTTSYDTSDGVHPDAGGHAKIAAAMLALLP